MRNRNPEKVDSEMDFGDVSLEELRKYEDIPPSKSEWPGDESDPGESPEVYLIERSI